MVRRAVILREIHEAMLVYSQTPGAQHTSSRLLSLCRLCFTQI